MEILLSGFYRYLKKAHGWSADSVGRLSAPLIHAPTLSAHSVGIRNDVKMTTDSVGPH